MTTIRIQQRYMKHWEKEKLKRLTFRLDPDLYKKLKQECFDRKISIVGFIEDLIRDYFKKNDPDNANNL